VTADSVSMVRNESDWGMEPRRRNAIRVYP
jgi:hypothetical protein